jgi:hypothetical protein
MFCLVREENEKKKIALVRGENEKKKVAFSWLGVISYEITEDYFLDCSICLPLAI